MFAMDKVFLAIIFIALALLIGLLVFAGLTLQSLPLAASGLLAENHSVFGCSRLLAIFGAPQCGNLAPSAACERLQQNACAPFGSVADAQI